MSDAAASTDTGSAPAADTNAGSNAPANGAITPTPTTQGAAPASVNQPSKVELKELGEENMNQIVKMKVDGKMVQMTVREALKQAELGSGAQKKMQEAAQLRKNVQRLLENEEEYFKVRGIDPDQYATERLVKKYERMALTPEQKANMEKNEKLQQYEARDTQAKNEIISQIKNLAAELPPEYVKALEGATPEQLQQELKIASHRYQQSMQNIEKEFIDAWQETGLPKDTVFGTWVASLLHASQVQKNQGQREDALSAKDAAAIVKNNFMSAVGRITGEMDAQSIHQLLGPQTMQKLREYDINRVTGKGPEFVDQNAPRQPSASRNKNTKVVNESGWKNAWAKLGV